MRRLMLILSGLMIAATVQTRAQEWNVFSINQNPVPPNAIVSFSIGYPKGWKVYQDSNWRHDIYYGLAIGPAGEMICRFNPPSEVITTNFPAEFMICYDRGLPARDAAQSFPTRTDTKKTLSPVKTAAGHSGWLLESEGDFKIGRPIGRPIVPGLFKPNVGLVVLIPVSESNIIYTVEKVIDHEYFFHSGSRGSIRIAITTPVWNSVLRSDLDKLVLQTLRFSGP